MFAKSLNELWIYHLHDMLIFDVFLQLEDGALLMFDFVFLNSVGF